MQKFRSLSIITRTRMVVLMLVVFNSDYGYTQNFEFNYPDDYDIWTSLDTIPNKDYSQEERQALVDSFKNEYRNSEFYKVKWSLMDTIEGKIYSAEEKDSILQVNFRKENSEAFNRLKGNNGSAKEKNSDEEKSSYYFVILLIIFGPVILVLLFKKTKKTAKETDKTNAIALKDMMLNYDINIEDSSIHFKKLDKAKKMAFEKRSYVKIESLNYEMKIYEDGELLRTYVLEQANNYDSFLGKYFHFAVRLNPASGVQIDGILSDTTEEPSSENFFFAFRFEAFYLSINKDANQNMIGKSSFDKGLNYRGYVTPGNLAYSCICDSCKKGFNLLSWHTGFSDYLYFYSKNSKEVLSINQRELTEITSGNNYVDLKTQHKEIEDSLPESKSDGKFEYYNSLCCPHCSEPYIDFGKYPEIRDEEYYAHYYINQEVTRYPSDS